jgi:hypothetical protein
MAYEARGEITRLAAANSLGIPVKREDYENPLEKIAQLGGISHTQKSISMSAIFLIKEIEEFYKSNNNTGLYQPDLEDIQKILKTMYDAEKNQGNVQSIK